MSAHPTVALRVDASARIGLGHLSRCLALAQALASRGAHCTFLCGELDAVFAGRISRAGHALGRLPQAAIAGAAEDCEASLDVLGRAPDVLVLDHYQWGLDWERQARRSGARIAVIDDLANRRHDCDVLVDHNAGRKDGDYDDLVPGSARRLVGPRFALVARQFGDARAAALARRQATAQVRKVLVSLGGSSVGIVQRRVVEALARAMATRELDVTIVSPHPVDVEAWVGRAAANRFRVVVDAEAMWGLAAEADLAIGAAGVSALERCVVGLPTICLTLADNQEPGARALAAAGAHWYIGSASAEDFPQRLDAALAHACSDAGALAAMAVRAADACDGHGSERVAARLLTPGITMRRAVADDAERVHAWRNDERVRMRSFDTAPIPLEAHLDWFRQALASPSRRLLVAEVDGEPVGFVRFDVGADEPEISVFLDPERIGSGLGTPVIEAACACMAAEGFSRVIARVRADNPASRVAFERAGFSGPSAALVRDLQGGASR